MFRVCASLLLVLVGFAGAAGAVDVDLSMSSSVGYDNNIFRTDKDTKDDATFRFGPAIRVRDETSKLSYNVSYNPVYEKFVTWTDADAWAHFAHGALDYQLGDRTLMSLSENFRFAQSLNQGPLVPNQDSTGTDIEFVPDTDVQREDVYLNTAKAILTHNFTAHTQGEFTIKHDYFNSQRNNTATNNSLSGFANVMTSLTSRDQVGFGGGTTWQQFDSVNGQPQTDTYIFRVAASWIHNFGEDTELTVRAGPAVIYTNQDNGSTTSAFLYPFNNAVGPTIENAYGALGLKVPADVQDINGNPLNPSDPIGAGSVLIPEGTNAKCFNAMVSGQTVFDRSNCSYNVVVDSTAFGALANTISTAGMVPLNYVGSNKGESDTRVTGFGEISLSHNWIPELSSSTGFTRSDSAATSLGASTIENRVMVETTWTPTRRWDLQVRGDWLKRKSATAVTNTYLVIDGTPVGYALPLVTSTALVANKTGTSINTEYWRVSGRVAYRTSRRSTVTLRASYQHQDTVRGESRTNATFDNVLVFLGFRYDLDPFHF